MPKYLLEGTYTAEGARGLIAEGGSSRRATVEAMIAGMHGRIESFYYAFGRSDVFVIVDVPDVITLAALSLAVNQSGSVSLKAHALFSAEEMDQAAKRSPTYRPPGQ